MNSKSFFEKIGYEFHEVRFLENALTHSSYCHEGKQTGKRSNERLEFLGDSIFNAVIAAHLYIRADDVEEGKLTKLRALIVCERSLEECALRLGIGEDLFLGKGEAQNGGRTRSSILADAMEAIIAAVYLDGGWDAATEVVLRCFAQTIEKALNGRLHSDYKTEFQERVQARGGREIFYRIDEETGPDHQKQFYISVWVDGVRLGEGSGKTKKEAEQNAAKVALEG